MIVTYIYSLNSDTASSKSLNTPFTVYLMELRNSAVANDHQIKPFSANKKGKYK